MVQRIQLKVIQRIQVIQVYWRIQVIQRGYIWLIIIMSEQILFEWGDDAANNDDFGPGDDGGGNGEFGDGIKGEEQGI